MIDPFTAFAMAQGAVKGIKAAIALGKDINSLMGDFSKFYHHADEVHVASTKMRMATVGKSDAQISSDSLQIAMASKALRDHEKELKDILYWSGNATVWEEMMRERVRMMKERAAMEKIVADKKLKDKEALAELIMTIMYLIGALLIIVPLLLISFELITQR
jgi:VIT1/CCC1 family predicted Fe2+/Mn2+ transporter